MSNHITRLHSAVLLAVLAVAGVGAQPAPQTHSYTVFLRQRPVGQESVTVTRTAEGIAIRGSNSLGPPLDVTTRTAEIIYTADWQPTRLLLEGTTRGAEVTVRTSFAGGDATSEISLGGETQKKVDAVAPDALVLPNAFLGSYAALALRLQTASPDTTFRAYIAPQGEVPMRLVGVFAERIETPRQAIAATRYALTVSNPPPGGDMPISVWTDSNGVLLRMSVPAQMLELARDDIASAAARTTAFAIPGDETVHIPAAGFNLAGSLTTPTKVKGPPPVVILVGGVTVADRDSIIDGVPVLGRLAASLADAGFAVVRYDRRGVGQSGGRAETATINDYAEDVRAVLTWIEKERKDLDRRRIAVVGHSEGAWVALRAAERDNRIDAVALLDAASVPGAELVLEQQRLALERAKTPEAEQREKIELQQRINAAALKGEGWDGIPESVRTLADTPWFQSFLAFDPADVIRDVRQALLIVRGDTNDRLGPQHAARLAELARARRRKAAVDVVDSTTPLGEWLARHMR
jgi:pimeloyl-ACP methyl ester carboxylesterase